MLVVTLSVGMLISAAYAVRTVGRLFTGPVRAEMRTVQDLRTTEMIAAGTLAAGIVLLGVFPSPALRLMAASIAHFAATFPG